MTLDQACIIIWDNKHGIKHNYWDEYLPAVLLVNKIWPITGYKTVEEEDDSEQDYVTWKQEQNERYDFNHQL